MLVLILSLSISLSHDLSSLPFVLLLLLLLNDPTCCNDLAIASVAIAVGVASVSVASAVAYSGSTLGPLSVDIGSEKFINIKSNILFSVPCCLLVLLPSVSLIMTLLWIVILDCLFLYLWSSLVFSSNFD